MTFHVCIQTIIIHIDTKDNVFVEPASKLTNNRPSAASIATVE